MWASDQNHDSVVNQLLKRNAQVDLQENVRNTYSCIVII